MIMLEQGHGGFSWSEEAEPATPTLEINPDNVLRLIQLAREFHAKENMVDPDGPDKPTEDWPADDWPVQVRASGASNSSLEEFRSIIVDLDRDQQVQVVALLWLGRGDYEVEDWETLLEEVDEAWTERTADYLIAHPMLADYLEEGLLLLGYDVE